MLSRVKRASSTSSQSSLQLRKGRLQVTDSCSSLISSLPSISTTPADTKPLLSSKLQSDSSQADRRAAATVIVEAYDVANDRGSGSGCDSPTSTPPPSDCCVPVQSQAAASACQDSPDSSGAPGALRPPADTTEPELVGFVLLDPLWQSAEEIGYVASLMRMKRSAHTGRHRAVHYALLLLPTPSPPMPVLFPRDYGVQPACRKREVYTTCRCHLDGMLIHLCSLTLCPTLLCVACT